MRCCTCSCDLFSTKLTMPRKTIDSRELSHFESKFFRTAPDTASPLRSAFSQPEYLVVSPVPPIAMKRLENMNRDFSPGSALLHPSIAHQYDTNGPSILQPRINCGRSSMPLSGDSGGGGSGVRDSLMVADAANSRLGCVMRSEEKSGREEPTSPRCLQ